METKVSVLYAGNLSDLCLNVRRYIRAGEYDKCFEIITAAMGKYPHAPHPHNLLGILLEIQGSHFLAMKHFRAAYYLEPAYRPTQLNLKYFGSYGSDKRSFFDESDCNCGEETGTDTVTFDAFGISHVQSKKKFLFFHKKAIV